MEAISLFQENNIIIEEKKPAKRKKTIREASVEVFEKMPLEFKSINYCIRVRRLLKSSTMDGTILRRLRELRKEGKCPYEVKDNRIGLYKKIIRRNEEA